MPPANKESGVLADHSIRVQANLKFLPEIHTPCALSSLLFQPAHLMATWLCRHADRFGVHTGGSWSRRPMKAPNLQTLPLQDPPYLVICAEGLCETEHPYAFASRACFQALIRELSPGVMYCRETIPSERRERAREANCTTTSGVRIFSTRIRKFISY